MGRGGAALSLCGGWDRRITSSSWPAWFTQKIQTSRGHIERSFFNIEHELNAYGIQFPSLHSWKLDLSKNFERPHAGMCRARVQRGKQYWSYQSLKQNAKTGATLGWGEYWRSSERLIHTRQHTVSFTVVELVDLIWSDRCLLVWLKAPFLAVM